MAQANRAAFKLDGIASGLRLSQSDLLWNSLGGHGISNVGVASTAQPRHKLLTIPLHVPVVAVAVRIEEHFHGAFDSVGVTLEVLDHRRFWSEFLAER